jgi:hypothetical protein
VRRNIVARPQPRRRLALRGDEGAGAGADQRADRRAFTAARDPADDRASRAAEQRATERIRFLCGGLLDRCRNRECQKGQSPQCSTHVESPKDENEARNLAPRCGRTEAGKGIRFGGFLRSGAKRFEMTRAEKPRCAL